MGITPFGSSNVDWAAAAEWLMTVFWNHFSGPDALYGDSLGPRGSNGDTYLKMQRANADAMVRGFTAGASGCPISR